MGTGRGFHRVIGTAALAALAFGAGGGPASALGVIDITDSTVQSGSLPFPTGVTIDPAAPGSPPAAPDAGAAPAAPSLGGAMPAFPGAGDGTDGAFAAAVDTTLAGGTWNFTSFTVSNLATVEVTGAAVILVQGDASINGRVFSNADGFSLMLVCGGGFELMNVSRFETLGANSDVLVAAGTKIDVGSGLAGGMIGFAMVRAVAGDVELRAHGPDPMAGDTDITVDAGQVLAPAGSVTLLSAEGITVGGGTALTPGDALAGGGAFLARAFGDGIAVTEFGEVDAANGSPATLESAGRIDFDGQWFAGGATAVRLAAVLGPVAIGGSIGASTGGIEVLSGAGIAYTKADTEVSVGGFGSLLLSAAAGSIVLTSQDCRSYTSGGTLTAVASGDIHLFSNSFLSTFAPNLSLSVRSSGGSVILEDSSSLDSGGPLAILAGADFSALGGGPTVRGQSVQIGAEGSASISLITARATSGGFGILASGPVVVDRTLTAAGSVSVASLGSDLNLDTATVRTDDQTAPPSGSITVESWNPDAQILATEATIRSGTSSSAPGAVSLLVHGTLVVLPPVESFLLPKKVKATKDGDRSRLVAAGIFDTGPDPADLGAAATVDVGGLSFPIEGLVPNAKATAFVHREPGLVLLVIPSKTGSSRARFRLVALGAGLEGAVNLEDDLALSFDNGAILGTGTVGLEAGKYVLGRKRGALKEPNLWLAKARAKVVGDGMDVLSLRVGLATDGETPTEAPSLQVAFGDSFTQTFTGEQFAVNGGVLSAVDGGVKAVLDYRRELLTVSARGINLGNFLEGAQPVSVRLTLGGETREVRVRMVKKGARLGY